MQVVVNKRVCIGIGEEKGRNRHAGATRVGYNGMG